MDIPPGIEARGIDKLLERGVGRGQLVQNEHAKRRGPYLIDVDTGDHLGIGHDEFEQLRIGGRCDRRESK